MRSPLYLELDLFLPETGLVAGGSGLLGRAVARHRPLHALARAVDGRVARACLRRNALARVAGERAAVLARQLATTIGLHESIILRKGGHVTPHSSTVCRRKTFDSDGRPLSHSSQATIDPLALMDALLASVGQTVGRRIPRAPELKR